MSLNINDTPQLSPLPSQQKPKKLGPCCVCKQTKKLRDQCLFEKSESQCQDLIYKHNDCLRQHGFQPVK